MEMIGANRNPEVAGADKMLGKVNYFNGRDRANWSSQVATYARVNYREVYPGVDLVYYGKQQQLEYDFIVAPNRDPRKIRLGFSGVRGLSIDKTGALVLETDAGEIRQQPPVAYQEIDGRRQAVEAAYVLKKQREVGLKVGNYDPSKTLVIDPVVDYSRYLGGSGQEEGGFLDHLLFSYLTTERRTNLRGAVGTHSLPRERRRAFAQAERRANAFQTPHRSWLQLRFALYSLTIVPPTDEVPGRG